MRHPASARLAPQVSDAIALRNRFAMVKGAWEEHLRGVPFPALGEGTAEEKIERLELALVDEMRRRATPETAEQAADAMWTLVHARDDADPVKQRVTVHPRYRAPAPPGKDADPQESPWGFQVVEDEAWR